MITGIQYKIHADIIYFCLYELMTESKIYPAPTLFFTGDRIVKQQKIQAN